MAVVADVRVTPVAIDDLLQVRVESTVARDPAPGPTWIEEIPALITFDPATNRIVSIVDLEWGDQPLD